MGSRAAGGMSFGHRGKGLLQLLPGIFALGYGWLWARVALTGQRQRWVRARPRECELR